MVDFAGWEMPQQYSSVKQEQQAVRSAAGLFDVSHMGRLSFEGEGAGGFLNGLVTNDLAGLEPGHAQYNLLCREDGGIIDDLVIYHDREGGWHAVVNASNRDKDVAWMRGHAPPAVTVRDRSEELALIALQGPGAQAMLPAEGVDVDSIPYFGVERGRVAGAAVLISRTGYTGEDGFELFIASDRVGSVWDALVAAGATPSGLAARDVCRLEAGLRLYGSDMDEQTNPYEAGLGWTVRLDKGDFIGRAALAAAKAQGPRRRLVGLECGERTIPRHHAGVAAGGRLIGTVTSGTYSFFLQRGIAMASLEGAPPPGAPVQVETRGGDGSAQVARLPFYRGSVRQATRA